MAVLQKMLSFKPCNTWMTGISLSFHGRIFDDPFDPVLSPQLSLFWLHLVVFCIICSLIS